jgi:hypothetical protein
MPAVNLSPVGGVAAQFFTNTGAVLTGGKIYTYLAGTTTPAATYTTSAGNVARTNPVVLDAAGRVSGSGEIWLTQGVVYKFVLEDANSVLIATYDNISGISSTTLPIDSSNITYDPPFTNPVQTNVELKLAQTISVKDFGAVGNGTTDDTTSIKNASAYIQSIGGGTLYFPQGTYRTYSNGSTDPLGNFSSLSGIALIFDGAELVVDRTFTGVENQYMFVFTACKNIKLSNTIASCTQTQPVGQKTSRGAALYRFLQGCENISADNTYADSLRAVWDFHREIADPVSYSSKVINIGCTTAVDCGYPLLGSLSGNNLRSQLSTLRCGRSYFFTGASDHVVHLRSTNHEASADCLLATDAGQGMQDVDLKYVNVDSTTNDLSIACVRVEYQDGQLYNGIHKNIKVDFNIQTVVGVSALGFAFEISKVANDLPDPTDRGHVLDGITLTGNINNPSGRGIAMCIIGTWGAGEFIRNIKVDNLRNFILTPVSMNLSSLKDVATVQNLTSNTAVETTGNTVGKIVYLNCDVNGATTASTADTSLIDYHSCNIRSATTQSRINKAFFNTYVGTELVTSFRGTYNVQIALAAAAIVSLTPPGNSADVAGILDVVDVNGDMARFALNGSSNTTQEVNDPSSKYSVTAGAVSINVYWSAGNGRYEIQNGTASNNSVRFCVTYFAV